MALRVDLDLPSRHSTPKLALILLKCSHKVIFRFLNIIFLLLRNSLFNIPNMRPPCTIRLPGNLCHIVFVVLLVLIDPLMHLIQPVIIHLLLTLGNLLRQFLILDALKGLGIQLFNMILIEFDFPVPVR